MPNWCSNELVIEGPADKVAQLVNEVAQPYSALYRDFDPSNPGTFVQKQSTVEGPLLLWNIVKPTSEELHGYWGDENDNGSWYAWNVKCWGTKWDLGNGTSVDHTPGRVTYNFESAWSPPMAAMDILATSNPDLNFTLTYDEPGMDFAGIVEWQGGAVTSEIETTSRDRYCEICDENYQLGWDEEDAGCPNVAIVPDGSWSSRMHLAQSASTSAEDLDGIAKGASNDADDDHDDEEILCALAYNPNVARDTCIYIAVNSGERARRVALGSFTHADADEFARSDDPELKELASLIVVGRATN